MALHKDLTGADLHESKGVASASVNTVYVANGAGSGTWKKVPSAGIDGTSVLNVNRQFLSFMFPDIGTAGSRYLPLPRACSITKITVALQSATATTATVLTFRNDAGTSMGTLSIGAGALAGAVGTLTPASNNTFSADTKLQVDTDGGTTNTPAVEITLEVTWL
jgi:hypothetical protein